MSLTSIWTSCDNIEHNCIFRIWRNHDSYLEKLPGDVVFSDSWNALPWNVQHEFDVVFFKVHPGGRVVDVLMDMEVETDE